MLQPKRQKYRKQFRGSMKGTAVRGGDVEFGEYGLKAMECGWLTARQIEAARRAIVHFTKRAGKTWVRAFPDKPVTKKPAGQGMGGGKGDIDHYVAVIRPGRMMFEIAGIPETEAKEALTRASHKLPFKSRIVTKG